MHGSRSMGLPIARMRPSKRSGSGGVAGGYEKSDDYGGKPPGWGSYVATAIAAGVIIATLLGLR